MNFSSVLIVTYGRSGSTLLQGLLNSIDGCLIRGENYNLCYGLFEAYEALVKTKQDDYKKGQLSLKVEDPWYGAALLDENKFLEDARKLVLNQLNPESLQLNCIGFKEIRYIGNFSLKKLYGYLNFLEKLFPNPAFIALTRDHNQVMNSAWWQKQDAKKIDAELTEFEAYISHYGKNKTNVFYIDYSDMMNKTQNLNKMFEFLGASYDKATIDGVLSIQHSYQAKPSETYTLQVEKTEHPIVQYAKLDKLPITNFHNATISGIVVISAANVDNNFFLVGVNSGSEYKIKWESSPFIKEKFSENPNAAKARFKLEGLKITPQDGVEIYLEDEFGKRYLLFKLSLSL